MAEYIKSTNGLSGSAEPTGSSTHYRPTELVELSAQQLADLNDAGKQAEYHQAYLLQLQRQACPGCGDDFVVLTNQQSSDQEPEDGCDTRSELVSREVQTPEKTDRSKLY